MADKKYQSGLDSILKNTLDTPKAAIVPSEEKPKLVTINCKLTEAQHRELKMFAVSQGTTIMQIVSQAIEDYLHKHR